jgi:antirestriction protein ArdC
MASTLTEGYPANWWITFNQAKERAATSTRASTANLWSSTSAPVESETDDVTVEHEAKKDMRRRPILKVYTVFNIAQCSGLEVPDDAP